jgi:hypothetical protein
VTADSMSIGRQPQPVTVTVQGDEKEDVEYWLPRPHLSFLDAAVFLASTRMSKHISSNPLSMLSRGRNQVGNQQRKEVAVEYTVTVQLGDLLVCSNCFCITRTVVCDSFMGIGVLNENGRCVRSTQDRTDSNGKFVSGGR